MQYIVAALVIVAIIRVEQQMLMKCDTVVISVVQPVIGNAA